VEDQSFKPGKKLIGPPSLAANARVWMRY